MDFMITIIVTVIAAILSANLAVGRFKKERTWEKKEEAYSLLIKGIRSSIEYSEIFLEYRHSQPCTVTDEELDEAFQRDKESIDNAKQIMHSNYLFMTKAEISVVESLLNGLNFPEEMDSVDMAYESNEYYKDLLIETEKRAKESLYIEQSNTYIIFSHIWNKFDKILEPIAIKTKN